MATATIEERLAAVRHHLEELETRAKSVPADAKPRVKRHLAALQKDMKSADAALEGARARTAKAAVKGTREVEDRIELLDDRVEVAEHSLTADVARDAKSFMHAVEDELRTWNDYLDHLQAKSATKKAAAELKLGVDRLAKRLKDAQAMSGKQWDAQKKRVIAAREELERKADELAAKLK